MSDRLKEYRKSIQSAHTAQRDRNDPYSCGIRALTRALLIDLDNKFPEISLDYNENDRFSQIMDN